MGEALLAGIIGGGWVAAHEVRVVERDAERRDLLSGRFDGIEVTDTIGAAEGTVVAVKPGDVARVVAEVVAGEGGRIVSIAAGITLTTLEAAAGPGVAVVRAMPNTPALVGKGAAGIAAGAAADDVDMEWAEALLGSVGIVERVPESLIDAVTGVSGSGPAYVFLIAEALIDAGVLVGLPRDMSERLAVQTLLGASTLLATVDDDAASLRAAVTSPGGTTAAAVRTLEQHGVRAAILDAVVAARDRAVEMG